VLFPDPHVLVTGLQTPEAQAALTPLLGQAGCNPSLGSVAPGPALVVQVNVERAQYWLPAQSLSTQQPVAVGTQALVLLSADALQ
jgi:hypothetical protein